MDRNRVEFFLSLLNTPSPSGYEGEVQRLWRADASQHADEVVANAHGSLVATVRGREGGPSILLMGHCDEIGLLVHYIDDSGFLYLKPIGGIDAPTLVNQHVRLLGPGGIVRGVIGRKAIHLMKGSERDSAKIEVTDLCIDLGAAKRDEAEKLAPVGTPGVVGGDAVELLNGRIAARCVDNKFGCFVAAEVLRRVAARKGGLAATLHAASTAQEECGVWDARGVAYDKNPTAAIAIDVTHATDTPDDSKKQDGDFPLGKGPIVKTGVLASKKLVRALCAAGERAGIPVRVRAETGRHGTDADPAATVRGGIPVTTIAVPLRYMHTSVEVGDLNEIDQVCGVLTEFVVGLQEGADFSAL